MVSRIMNSTALVQKQVTSIMSPKLLKNDIRLSMQVSLGLPRLTSVNRQYRLYQGLTKHQPEQLNTDSRNMIELVAQQVELSQVSQFSALIGSESLSVLQLSPMRSMICFCVGSQEWKLQKQQGQVLQRVSFAAATVSRNQMPVSLCSLQALLSCEGYLIRKASKMMNTMKQTNMVMEQAMTNLFFLRMRPQIPDRLDTIIMTDVVMKIAMKPLRKSGRICAVTEEIRKAQTSTYSSMMPNSRVITIPTEIKVLSQYTDKNIIDYLQSQPLGLPVLQGVTRVHRQDQTDYMEGNNHFLSDEALAWISSSWSSISTKSGQSELRSMGLQVESLEMAGSLIFACCSCYSYCMLIFLMFYWTRSLSSCFFCCFSLRDSSIFSSDVMMSPMPISWVKMPVLSVR